VTPIRLKLKPGDSQLLYIVTDDAAFSVKRWDGQVAIVVLSRGEWEIALDVDPKPGAPTIHVTKAVV
jgi:hypothetical protein